MNCNKPLYSAGIIIELTPDQGGPRKFQSKGIQWNLAKRGIRDPAPTKYSPLSMCYKDCVESGT